MSTISLEDAKASFSRIVDQAGAGDFVTITRHGEPAAVLVSLDAAEAAKKAARRRGSSLVDHLLAFPDGDGFDHLRNPTPSRNLDL